MDYKIIAVTPAGRKQYLELLKQYVLNDGCIAEWQLWDNCRTDADREYINILASQHPKIKIIRTEGTAGINRDVNKFYRYCNDTDAFYLKIDDDVVYIKDGCARKMLEKAVATKDRCIWWSPLVINNAVSSWLLKYHTANDIPQTLTCQAGDQNGWKNPEFAAFIHTMALDAIRKNEPGKFSMPDFEISLSRFSINFYCFFGETVRKLGEAFCPPDVDDEEWLSAVLPSREGKKGLIVGSEFVVHFAFHTQERHLLEQNILAQYYELAGLEYKREKKSLVKKEPAQKKRTLSRLRKIYKALIKSLS
jgi:Glycosyl transferase family 2.